MDRKIEEMIALGASYALNCQPCMEYHRKKAVEAGVTDEEMRAALRVADAVKAGAGKKARSYAESMFGEVASDRCCPVGSECCS